MNSSGIVTMVIDQSVSSTTGDERQPRAVAPINSPSFTQRQVSTQVTVQDGDTIAIGGIILETDSLSTSGIPLLDRIPYLGNLFQTASYSKGRTELSRFSDSAGYLRHQPDFLKPPKNCGKKVKSLTKSIKDH